ncbi:sugar ABC transporter substrate-binding protein [Paenibacillus psychroresistens]|uniref:Sugar ABC transporter substrate-binding protein n=1 Tax=Paenibacillus psychroresistens TaxID=1778678 RepID=A0A6B8RRP9_9BACL|nr:sugar ABC transporter substrate-binding protein [Paenibacillus psychroresistens]QGQ98163.1 sugar ABC transporter substrate-binding protein [Paenibacillus psychroresistens]
MKKTVSLMTITALVFVLLAGCGGNSNSSSSAAPETAAATAAATTAATAEPTATEAPTAEPAAPAEIVTIKTSITNGELSKDQIAEFEQANPNIKIEIVELDATKLAAQLATGDAPDVLRISGAFETGGYVIKGIAMDLTEQINASTVINKDDLMDIDNVFRFDGQTIGKGPIYGLPKDWSSDYTIWYNKKVFEAAGVALPDPTIPLTWPEIMALAKKLTIKGKQYGLAATEWGKTEPNFNIMLDYLASAGVAINAPDNSSMDFNNQAVKDFIAMWVDAVKSNIGPNSVNGDKISGGDLFTQNKLGMLINGYWYSGALRSNDNSKTHLSDFGMMPAPLAPGGKRVSPTGGATGAIINKASKHPKEAWTFFEWFFAGKPADDRAKTGWGLPAFTSKMSLLPQETDFDKAVYAVLQDELKYSGDFLPVNPYLSGGGWGIFDKYVNPLYFGKSNIDDAVKGMTKDANVAITEAKNAMN